MQLLPCYLHALPLFSANPQPEGESPVGQRQHLWNNQDSAEQIKTNVVKETGALPLEICNWVFKMPSMQSFFPSFEPYLFNDMEKVTVQTFLHRFQSHIPHLFWGKPTLQLKTQPRLQCTRSWGLCHHFLRSHTRRESQHCPDTKTHKELLLERLSYPKATQPCCSVAEMPLPDIKSFSLCTRLSLVYTVLCLLKSPISHVFKNLN